jgi:hypothetical protein
LTDRARKKRMTRTITEGRGKVEKIVSWYPSRKDILVRIGN